MLYVVRFFDRVDRLGTRNDFLRAHIAWLDQHRDVVLVAGSLRTEAGANPVGGLWIVEAPTKDAIESLLATDPFWVHGLRERYEILLWSKAFPERVVPV